MSDRSNNPGRPSITTVTRLIDAGLAPASQATDLSRVAARYAVAITDDIRGLIAADDPSDPIAAQFVPTPQELQHHPAEIADPIGDLPHTPVPGIVHRYPNKALLKIANVCPVYCRFCFRREMIGPQSTAALDKDAFSQALAYIADHSALEEIIMTGGDPLIMSPRRISEVTHRLSNIDHVRKLRWHTRVPVVKPGAVTDALVSALADTNRQVRIAIHANHPREFTGAARLACQKLLDAGIELLSQTVLLRAINDDEATLSTLLQTFEELGITPYYLHHGDLAPGTSHFRTTIEAGLQLMERLARRHAPAKMPTYILDLPGGHGKVPVNRAAFQLQPDGGYQVTASCGARFAYRDAV